MSLPTNSLPGKDLMSKRIVQELKVVNFITDALTETKDDYFVGNCEWKNGTRSDIVLEPKSVDLPPIIIEIQHNVNKSFFRRAIGYCLQANSKFDVNPILLIICVGKLSQDIQKHTTPSRIPGIYSFFCIPRAEECFIMYEDSISQDLASPLNPLVALGIFFRNRSMTIIDHPHATDPTIQYLYTLLLHFHQIDFQSIASLPSKLIDSQIAEYDKLINLANTLNQPELVETVNESKSRISATKRQYNDYLYAEESSSAIVTNNNDDDDVAAGTPEAEVRNTVDRREAYEAGMKFVDEFKQKRDDKGKRMDWKGCLEEGKHLLKYKKY